MLLVQGHVGPIVKFHVWLPDFRLVIRRQVNEVKIFNGARSLDLLLDILRRIPQHLLDPCRVIPKSFNPLLRNCEDPILVWLFHQYFDFLAEFGLFRQFFHIWGEHRTVYEAEVLEASCIRCFWRGTHLSIEKNKNKYYLY